MIIRFVGIRLFVTYSIVLCISSLQLLTSYGYIIDTVSGTPFIVSVMSKI